MPDLIPNQLFDCLQGKHCSCEVPGSCCYCEFFVTEQGVRNAIPLEAREEDIQAFLALCRELGTIS